MVTVVVSGVVEVVTVVVSGELDATGVGVGVAVASFKIGTQSNSVSIALIDSYPFRIVLK